MKELARVNALLSHRHYGEGAYEHRKDLESLNDLKMMTYGAAVRTSSLFRYVDQEYLRYAGGSIPTVLLGLGGVAELNNQQQTELAETIITIAKRKKDADIYLHAACHIKLLSHDGRAYLGSQNLSSGAEPYFKDMGWKKKHFHRHHEIIVEVENSDLGWIDTLFDQVLADHPLYIQVSDIHRDRAKANALVARFVSNAQIKKVNDNLTAAQELDAFLMSGTNLMKIEYSATSSSKLCKGIAAIAIAVDSNPYLDWLKSHVLLETDFAWFKQESAVAELQKIIDGISESFCGKKALNEMLALGTPLRFGARSNKRLIKRIKAIAAEHDLESLDGFLLKHRDKILYSVIAAPDYSEHYMFGAVDNDGNVDETMLSHQLSNSITTWEQDDDENLESFEHNVGVNQQLDRLNTTKLWEDLCDVFSSEINALWGSKVLKQAQVLSAEIKKLYEHELRSEAFESFLEQFNAGKAGQSSLRLTS